MEGSEQQGSENSDVMVCPNCKQQNPRRNRFCGQCGQLLPVICPTCGAANPVENRFCGARGTSLSESISHVAPSAGYL
jgi:hypothetical protein